MCRATYTFCYVGKYGDVRIITSVFSSSGSLSEHWPMQWLYTLQFHSIQDSGKELVQLVNINEWHSGLASC